MIALYDWLCKPVPTWFDRGCLVSVCFGLTLGLLSGHS